MISIAFEPVTTTNLPLVEYPPSILLNKELKKCFLDAATIFNTHYDIYPNKWNTEPASTGSAYVNTVTALYFNRMYGYTSVTSKYMHEVSRFIHQVATDYYSAEINTLAEGMPFKLYWTWEYTTRGFQYLRNYGLMECEGSCRADWSILLEFCEDKLIKFSDESPEVFIKINKVICINEEYNKQIKVEVPETTEPEVVSSVLSLLEQIVSGTSSLSSIVCEDKVKILRNGAECDVTSLTKKELLCINKQLDEDLLHTLLKLGMQSGPVT